MTVVVVAADPFSAAPVSPASVAARCQSESSSGKFVTLIVSDDPAGEPIALFVVLGPPLADGAYYHKDLIAAARAKGLIPATASVAGGGKVSVTETRARFHDRSHDFGGFHPALGETAALAELARALGREILVA